MSRTETAGHAIPAGQRAGRGGWIPFLASGDGPRHRRARRLVDAAALPDSLKRIILEVLDSARLWPQERAELAMELVAHFSDGLERGASEQSIASDFGDPRDAGKLMGRAKRRGRAWPWRVARTMLFALGGLIALYVVLAIRFFMGSPSISHDYRVDLNRQAAAVASDAAAWPLYRQALLGLVDVRQRLMSDPDPAGVRPVDPGWPACERLALDHADSIEMARQAAARPGLGLLLGMPLTAEEQRLWPNLTSAQTYATDSMFEILLPHLGSFRQLAKLITIDVRRAALAGDGSAVVWNFEAIFGIARHAREAPLVISCLVSAAIHNMAFERVMEVVHDFPESLDDRELERLAAAVEGVTDEDLRMNLEGERIGFADFLQRVYTDDGNGDGRMTADGLRFLNHISQWAEVQDGSAGSRVGMAAVQPLAGLVMLGRRELASEYDRMLSAVEAEVRVPLWQRSASPTEAEVQRWSDDPWERARRMPLSMLMPALSKAAVQSELVMQARDAARTAIALESFRRAHGRWPATLNELVPRHLSAVPRDRFDGAPLRYRPHADGPALYSIGANLVDDGGAPSPVEGEERQWQPSATLEARKTDPTFAGPLPQGDWMLYPPRLGPSAGSTMPAPPVDQ